MCRAEEKVNVLKLSESINNITLSGIWKGRQKVEAAYRGEEVTLTLNGLKKGRVEVHDRVTVKNGSKFKSKMAMKRALE